MKNKTLILHLLVIIFSLNQSVTFSQDNKSTYAVISVYDQMHGLPNNSNEFLSFPFLLTDLEGKEIKFKNGIVKNKKISKIKVISKSDLETYRVLINKKQIVYYRQPNYEDQYWDPKEYFSKRPSTLFGGDDVANSEKKYNIFINKEYSFATFKESSWYNSTYAVLQTDNYLDKYKACNDNLSHNLVVEDGESLVFLHTLTTKIDEGWSIDKIEKIFLKIVPNFYIRYNYNGTIHTGNPERTKLINLVRKLKHLPEAKKYFSSSEFRYATIAIYDDDAIFNSIQYEINNNNLPSTYKSAELVKYDLLNKLQVAPTYSPNLPHNLIKSYPMFSDYIKENSINLILKEQDNSYNFCMVGSDFVKFFPEYVKNNSKFVAKFNTCKFTDPKDISVFELFARALLSGKGEKSSSNNTDSETNQVSSKSNDNETHFDKCEKTRVPSVKKVGERGVSGFSYTYLIEFSDGIYGTLYLGDPSNKYFISDGLRNYYYKSYTSALNALYRYKKCEFISKIDRD